MTRVFACPQAQAHAATFSKGCASAVSWVTQTQLSDIHFSPKLAAACAPELPTLCPTALSGTEGGGRSGGQIIECLREREMEIVATDCKEEVRRYIPLRTVTYRYVLGWRRCACVFADSAQPPVPTACRPVLPAKLMLTNCTAPRPIRSAAQPPAPPAQPPRPTRTAEPALGGRRF